MPPTAVLPYEIFDLQRIADESGTLYVGEIGDRFNGAFTRIYFITSVPRGGSRGGHAHKYQDECLICVQGSVMVRLETRGSAEEITLGQAGRALYLPPGYWRDLVEFSEDAVIAVLAREPFDEGDYIRERAAFRAWGS